LKTIPRLLFAGWDLELEQSFRGIFEGLGIFGWATGATKQD
jgi:hypothetical protein